MWSTQHYRHLVRVSGWYDLIVTWTFLALHGLLQGWGQAMGLAGTLPSFAPLHVLMANLMGSIVCVWAVLRIRDPQPVFGRYDAVGRMLFATWQAYALSQGARCTEPGCQCIYRGDPVFRDRLGDRTVITDKGWAVAIGTGGASLMGFGLVDQKTINCSPAVSGRPPGHPCTGYPQWQRISVVQLSSTHAECA